MCTLLTVVCVHVVDVVRYIKQERSREQWEMENSPQGEIEEMIELYEGKGFSKEDAKTIIETMAKNEKFFVSIFDMQSSAGLLIL